MSGGRSWTEPWTAQGVAGGREVLREGLGRPREHRGTNGSLGTSIPAGRRGLLLESVEAGFHSLRQMIQRGEIGAVELLSHRDSAGSRP